MFQKYNKNLIEGNLFSGNKAKTKAGAIFILKLDLIIKNNTFKLNQAMENAGALIIQQTYAELKENIFL